MPSSEVLGMSAHGSAYGSSGQFQVAVAKANNGGDGEDAIREVKVRYHRVKPAVLHVRRADARARIPCFEPRFK